MLAVRLGFPARLFYPGPNLPSGEALGRKPVEPVGISFVGHGDWREAWPCALLPAELSPVVTPVGNFDALARRSGKPRRLYRSVDRALSLSKEIQGDELSGTQRSAGIRFAAGD